MRARAGRAARTAKVAVRTAPLSLHGPRRLSGKQPDFRVNVVEVRAVDAPEGVEPLHWLLLTSLPCRTWAEGRRVVRLYAMRWCVQEYHKALKSGTGVEDSQDWSGRIGSNRWWPCWGGMAVRLLQTQWLARTRPDEPVDPKVFGAEMLVILAAMFGQPQGGWTHRTVLVSVARVGGFLARRRDGLPGWQTIWRGWQRLMWMCHGLETLKPEQKRYG